jgi:MFS family permease
VIVLPILAALISLAFGIQLLARSGRRRAWHEAAWGVAMLMFAAATGALILGVADGWSSAEFRWYWLFGAVLTVPYLAVGELYLLVRPRWISHVLLVGVLAVTAVAAAIVRTAPVSEALGNEFPLGREVFGDGSTAHRLSQYYAYPAYFILVGGAIWSAFRIRGRPELRDRFLGTLLIAVGATIVFVGSGLGAGFGNFAVFSIGHAVGIAVMYWGFLVATRPTALRGPAPAS